MMRSLAVIFGLALILGMISSESRAATVQGESQKIGAGDVRVYAELGGDGKPGAIGVVFSDGAFEGLPASRNKTSRCFDLNGNGRIDDQGECEGDYEFRIVLPAELTARTDIPFGWVGLNWNPEGHPPEAWVPPHFDIHFYMVDRDKIDGIRVGGCDIFIDCDDFKRAVQPVPPQYVAPDHVNVNAAVSKMGNHLIDVRSPEFAKPPAPFTHTWIYGAYDGRIIFYEPMITMDFLLGKPDLCVPIRQPKVWAQAGYYPAEYCMRYDAGSKATSVSLEGFVLREGD
ncbi:MAG: hypothetical protein V3T80_04030 [Kiloniellales bacterium]